MDRVRVGLSGLGVVFLLTLGVSLAFGGRDAPTPLIESLKEPGEPLAQLGVAPGSEKAMGGEKTEEPSHPHIVVPPATPESALVPPGNGAVNESPVRTPPGQRADEVVIAI
ncbi:hypothetical protein L6Q21_05770 [Sandaracinobacter sp. RS1-74]|uniref:hypothetical protein n=1 Tax=Sandaracinobacteroides sayramensis TaxID=2913411 RepID=UPI001EDA6EE1|nr:hypothetical protein [Sandaracinobacteroides sayramensis]MCG2840485.1 hypothetical protein [Sandaracinobacteroides sayramensis]